MSVSQGTIRLRRPYSRDFFPAPKPVGCPTCGTEIDELANDPARYFAWKQRLRDHSIVAADDFRQQQVEVEIKDHFIGDVLRPEWEIIDATVPPILISGDGGYLQLEPSNILASGLTFGTKRCIKRSRNPIIEFRCQLAQTTQYRIQVGCTLQAGTFPLTQDYVIFQNNSGAGAANWFGLADATTDGGGSGSVDLGVLADTNDRRFKMVIDNAIPAVGFFVENLNTKEFELKGTLTSGIPTSLMEPLIGSLALVLAVKTSKHDYFGFKQSES